MIHLEAAAATDTGQVREGNEDAYHQGDSVFAVADGMGGHLAGEVASSTALEPVAALDGRVFPDADAAVAALRDAVVEANEAVSGRAREDPALRGMGTTLTAALLEGRRLHIAHVGDSRAYLLREGRLEQLTTDHTLVQHLIDEGQITPEEAATHPQRSIITRAVGVSVDVEVQTVTIEVREGDQVLLCSDGLSGVVTDEHITTTLLTERDTERVVTGLIEAANLSGGPDNVTVVLLRFDPDAAGMAGADGGGQGQAAAGTPAQLISTGGSRSGEGDGEWARTLGRFGTFGKSGQDAPPGEERDERASVRRWRRALAVVVAVGILSVLLAGGSRWLLSRSFFVGVDGEFVAIYRGIPSSVGPIDLHWVEERSSLRVDQVQDFVANDLEEGRAAVSLADARNIVANIEERFVEDPDPAPSPTATRSPTAAPPPSPTGAEPS